jgi:predicted ArsR family transcriptional regulator
MELSLEQRFGMVSSALFGNVGSIAKAVDKKFGATGRDVLRQVMSERGAAMGEMMKPMSPGKDFKSVGTFFSQAVKMFGVENEAKVNEEEVTVMAPKCPYGLEGTNKELCEAMMAFDRTAVNTISPDVTLEIVKTVAAGDPQCQLSIRAKK